MMKTILLMIIGIIVSVSILFYVDQAFALNQEQSDSKAAYEFILDECINPGDFAVGYIFENATHYMDNTSCTLYEKRMIKGPDNEIAEKRVLDNLPNFLKSPLKQIKAGVSINKIQCNDNLQLILKTRDNSPACVKPETAPKLIERGWGESEPMLEPDTGEFRYGEQECHYIDEKNESRSCIVSGWTKPVSELDCEEICKPPGTKE